MKASSVMTNLFANSLVINRKMIARGLSCSINHFGDNDFSGNSEGKLQQITRQQQVLIKHQQSLAHAVTTFNGRYIALSGPVQNNLMQRWRNDCPHGWEMSAKTHLMVGKGKITKVYFNTDKKDNGENFWNDLVSKIYSPINNNYGLADFFYKHSVIPSDHYPQWSKIITQENVVELEICRCAPETRDSMIAELSSLTGNPVYRLLQIVQDSDEELQHCSEIVRGLLKKVNNDGLSCAIVAIDVDQLKERISVVDLLTAIKQQFSSCGKKIVVLLMNYDEENISTFSHGGHCYHVEPPEEIRKLIKNQEALSQLLIKYNELVKEASAKTQTKLQKRLLSELPHGWRIQTIVEQRKFQITDLIFDVNTRVSDYLRHAIQNYVSKNQIPTAPGIDWQTTEEMLAEKIPWTLIGEDESHKCNEVVRNHLAKLRNYCADQGLDKVTQDAVDECALSGCLQTQV